jgi:effector-binding domain-containing protein
MEEMMNYEIKLIELPDQPVLSSRSILAVENLPEFFGKVYGSIIAYLEELGESPSGMPFAAYYNLDMSALDVEAGFPVAKALPARGEIRSGVIPAGKFLTTIHRGSYDTVEPAYNALADWAKANRLEPTGIAYEYYLNDPTEDPSVVAETEIRFPVQ